MYGFLACDSTCNSMCFVLPLDSSSSFVIAGRGDYLKLQLGFKVPSPTEVPPPVFKELLRTIKGLMRPYRILKSEGGEL